MLPDTVTELNSSLHHLYLGMIKKQSYMILIVDALHFGNLKFSLIDLWAQLTFSYTELNN